jgi:hypothetical protein
MSSCQRRTSSVSTTKYVACTSTNIKLPAYLAAKSLNREIGLLSVTSIAPCSIIDGNIPSRRHEAKDRPQPSDVQTHQKVRHNQCHHPRDRWLALSASPGSSNFTSPKQSDQPFSSKPDARERQRDDRAQPKQNPEQLLVARLAEGIDDDRPSLHHAPSPRLGRAPRADFPRAAQRIHEYVLQAETLRGRPTRS